MSINLEPEDFYIIPNRGGEVTFLTERGLRKFAEYNSVPVRVMSLAMLAQLREEKRSVYCPTRPMLQKPKPAAVVINMSGQVILQLILSGLYVYEPKPKQEKSA